jgi:hypothetical protein
MKRDHLYRRPARHKRRNTKKLHNFAQSGSARPCAAGATAGPAGKVIACTVGTKHNLQNPKNLHSFAQSEFVLFIEPLKTKYFFDAVVSVAWLQSFNIARAAL